MSRILIDEAWMEEIKGIVTPEEAEEFGRRYRFSTGRGKAQLPIADWCDESVQRFHDFLGQKAAAGNRSAKLSQTNVRQWQEIKRNPDGQVVGKLSMVDSALKEFIGNSENKYLFEQLPDGNFVPWFVKGIVYHEPTETSSASVSVGLVGINTGHERNRSRGSNSEVEEKSFRIVTEDIRKRTMSQILEMHRFFLETPARIKSMEMEVEKFLRYCDVDGFQMSVSGKAKLIKGWWENSWRSVGQDGRPAKMVVDPPDVERDQDSIHAPFWDKDEEKLWPLPIHPILEMFDLDEHADYRVHVNNVEPYVYDDTVDEKLVLPADIKDFLRVLIEHSKNKFADIVGGKEGGTIVLIEGLPGTGKTLTSEVYSEKMHRPLYKVQSSQLGIDVQTIEEQLKKVLQQAERWGAILLIDEADVYIHERGDDIHQNAIVGVFLRVLEYYRGVLFMTTNRGTTVDDAIISRTTARFMYEMPDKADQKRLWSVLSNQNGVGLKDEEIDKIVSELPGVSGRDIKNMLKLAMVAAANSGGRVTPGLVRFVSKFKQSGRVNRGHEPLPCP